MKDALKIAGKGILGIFSCFLAGKLLMAFGWMVAACFLTVTMGIVWSVLILNNRISTGALVLGIFAVIFAGIIPAILTDYIGFGFSQQNISVKNVKDYSFTTKFRFSDAHVEKDLNAHKSVYGRRSKVGDVYVAPIVASGWNKAGEITAWAVSELDEDDLWKVDYNSALQLKDDDDAREAIKRAVKKYKLRTTDDAMLLYWTPNPSGEWRAELISGILAPVISSIIWLIIHFSSYNYKGPIPDDKKNW